MYSANEVSEVLLQRGYDINSRTINYYAYDKKMFELEKGKKTFTEKEIQKIQFIKDLQQYTNYNLSQIKKIINNYSDEKIKDIISERIQKATKKGYSISTSDDIKIITTTTKSNLNYGDYNNKKNSIYSNNTLLNDYEYKRNCIIIIDNEIIIKTNCDYYNEKILKEVKCFIKFKLNYNKKQEEINVLSLKKMCVVKLENEDLLEILNIEKYENIKKEIIDFINYKLKTNRSDVYE